MEDIRNLTLAELTDFVLSLGLPKFRAKQIHEWLHVHNVSSYDDMTNLPKNLRAQLADAFPLDASSIIKTDVSVDGTRKYLIELGDDHIVETVGIPSQGFSEDEGSSSEDSDHQEIPVQNDFSSCPNKQKDRLTVCFSTQIGCPMACEFCATGKEGFTRNLSSSEMVDQIVAVSNDFDMRVGNVVAMGQGEPFLNYDELLLALRRINTDPGINIGARKITISTSGIIDGILKLAEEPEQFRLAISLHSAKQRIRNQLMPKLANQPLVELHDALLHYCAVKNRRVTLEYMLIDGINDSDSDLQALMDFCDGLNCHVNLIPLNDVEGSSFKPSPSEVIHHWVDVLESTGIPASIRHSKGSDIAGACGQLKSTY